MWRGSAVASDNNVIYIAPDGSYDIYCYKVKDDVWTKHRNRCPQGDVRLVLFGNELTAIGGRDASGHVTGRVLTLRQGKWIEELPSLIQPRTNPAVVSTDSHLLSIGGFTGDDWCSSVELLHKGDQAWTSLAPLPTTTYFLSATLIGEHIYIMADSKHSFVCSLTDILANKNPLPPLIWRLLPPFPPTVKSTPSSCSLGGQLVIVASDGAIYHLLHGKWKKCGHLSGVYRDRCLLASPSPNTMVAVGAASYSISQDDDITVDVCIIV